MRHFRPKPLGAPIISISVFYWGAFRQVSRSLNTCGRDGMARVPPAEVMANKSRMASRSLIAVSDVKQVFSGLVVKELARTAKLPAGSDIPRFAQSVRIAARIFLEAKVQLSAPQLCAAVARLHQLNSRAERGNVRAALALARAVDTLPADVRRWLTSCNKSHNRKIPTAAEIRSLATRQKAIERLRLILSYGSTWVAGRKRSSGRRSRSAKPLLRVPETLGRGRPPGSADREFVQWLAVAYLEAAGHPPPRTAHQNIDIRGPFPRFVHRCFELLGAPSGNVTRLINQYGTARGLVSKYRRAVRTP